MRTATRGNLFHRPATIDQLKILPCCRQKPEVEAEDGLLFPSHNVDHTGSRDSLRYRVCFLGKSPENDDWFTPSQLTSELIDPYKESLRIARARGRVLVRNLPEADIVSDSIHMDEKYDDPMQIEPQPLENVFEDLPQDPSLSSSSSISIPQPIIPDIPDAQLKSILAKRTSSGRLSRPSEKAILTQLSEFEFHFLPDIIQDNLLNPYDESLDPTMEELSSMQWSDPQIPFSTSTIPRSLDLYL